MSAQVDFFPAGDLKVANHVILGAGDGSEDTFTGIINAPSNPLSIVVTAGVIIGTDTGSDETDVTGTLSGTGVTSGTIAYGSGVITIVFTTPPGIGVLVTVDSITEGRVIEVGGAQVSLENVGELDTEIKVYSGNFKWTLLESGPFTLKHGIHKVLSNVGPQLFMRHISKSGGPVRVFAGPRS